MYSWLKRWASWLASAITLRARSVNLSNILLHHDADSALSAAPDAAGGEWRCQRTAGFRAVARRTHPLTQIILAVAARCINLRRASTHTVLHHHMRALGSYRL